MTQKQILIVEDNCINREILIEILSDRYIVLEAENGQKALDILNNCKDDIALILLDVMMPVMDGYTFLDRMKANPELAMIPVIVMTQSDSEEDELNALSHGATDFVPKPYRPQIIRHRVASIINLRETAAMANQFKYDQLTGLYSKGFFCQRVRELLQQNPEKEYDIICSNIEKFKLFNDAFGVAAGDQLLRGIAEVFREKAGEHEFCSRYNGDRFFCLCERGREYHDEMFLAINEEINRLPNAKNVVLKWGVYEIHDRSVQVEKMCDRVLLAADSIKEKYNQYFAVYDDALRDKLLREQAIVDSMESALQEGQFTVFLQPKYRLLNGELAGAEALVRWNHPERGFISPGEFIPVFEKNGFITQMDHFVWEQTCALLGEWQKKGYPHLPVSVNISRADFYQNDLVRVLQNLVGKYGISPRELHLEITESAYTEDSGQILHTVDELRKAGFIIEMDDFGSGYSSLNMLNQMSLDIVKLDMKFIQSETQKSRDQGILNYIVDLAHWLNLSVVAEGVETREQLVRLEEIGCDYAQGYFFAKPMPTHEFEKMLQELCEKEKAVPLKESVDENRFRYILVADADADYRNMVKSAFQDGFQILEAADGQSALACLSEHNQSIVVVILSMTLPEQGALSVLKFMNENQTAWSIPVLATGAQDSRLEMLAFQQGADDFAAKPHEAYSLKKRIKRLYGLLAYRERERQMQEDASQDFLTGLLNRRGFHWAVKGLRQEDLPLAICFFDLDDLKKTNDSFGHDVGDEMIQLFGDLLRHHTRSTDVLARYGGDEFVVILRHIPSEGFALEKGKEICDAFQECMKDKAFSVSCSAGIALCRVNERPSAELLKHADQALYRAKYQNKGGCCLWDGEVD